MLTAKQAKEQRRAIARAIEREHKKTMRAKLSELRKQIKEARAQRKMRLKELATQCRSERIAVRARLRERRARLLAELRETSRLERAAARETCMLRKGEAKEACGTAIGRARAELVAERQYQADLRRIERGNRARHAAHAKISRTERRGESDDEVRSNIPPELGELFEKVKRSIKAMPRMSRTEAFLKYAEENPHEAFALLDDKTERMIRELEQKQRDAEREARRGPSLARTSRTGRRTYTAAELAAVPF